MNRVSARRAAVTKYHGPGVAYKHPASSSRSSGGWRRQSRGQPGGVLARTLFQVADSPSPCVLWCQKGTGVSLGSPKGIAQTPFLRDYRLIPSHRPAPNTVTLGVRVSTLESVGDRAFGPQVWGCLSSRKWPPSSPERIAARLQVIKMLKH